MNPLPPEEIEAIAQAVGLPSEKVREIEGKLQRGMSPTQQLASKIVGALFADADHLKQFRDDKYLAGWAKRPATEFVIGLIEEFFSAGQ